jgi:glycosyltransferase WbpL
VLDLKTLVILLATVFVASWALTALSRSYALRRSVLDVPNERSAHAVPLPRGGGIAIAFTLFVSLAGVGLRGLLPFPCLCAWLGGGVLVAAVGWLDDHRPVPAGWRVLVHALAALWAVSWLGGLPELDLGFTVLTLGGAGAVLAVIALIWLTNLYNFMDGIDGLAGTQAVCSGAAAGMLLWWQGAQGLALGCFILAAASAGFLAWNWPPAKIFMGDAGSGLLGFSFGVLALAGERSGALPALVWVLLLSVFVSDTTFTLLRRMLRAERWYNAHRSHAYQRVVQIGYSHLQVTTVVLLVNVVVLWPLAWLASAQPRFSFALFLATMLVLGLSWREILKWE